MVIANESPVILEHHRFHADQPHVILPPHCIMELLYAPGAQKPATHSGSLHPPSSAPLNSPHLFETLMAATTIEEKPLAHALQQLWSLLVPSLDLPGIMVFTETSEPTSLWFMKRLQLAAIQYSRLVMMNDDFLVDNGDGSLH